jgi:hypothetical protein
MRAVARPLEFAVRDGPGALGAAEAATAHRAVIDHRFSLFAHSRALLHSPQPQTHEPQRCLTACRGPDGARWVAWPSWPSCWVATRRWRGEAGAAPSRCAAAPWTPACTCRTAYTMAMPGALPRSCAGLVTCAAVWPGARCPPAPLRSRAPRRRRASETGADNKETWIMGAATDDNAGELATLLESLGCHIVGVVPPGHLIVRCMMPCRCASPHACAWCHLSCHPCGGVPRRHGARHPRGSVIT